MSVADGTIRRGWCPSLFEPMASGDGLLLRIKPSASRLDARSARWIGTAAQRHGNGAIELTNRGNLQLRGFSPASAAAFAAGAVAEGLAAADPVVERRRNIVVSPLAGDDPGCDPRTLAVAAALEAGLATASGLDGLPGKFGFVVDGGGALGLGAVRGDVVLRAADGGWRVEAGNAGAACSAAEAASQAVRLARVAADCDRPLRPARQPECGSVLFEAAGLRYEAVARMQAEALVAVGPLPGRSFGIGLPPGRLDGGLLIMLAGLSERLGDGVLRVTAWRSLLLAGLHDGAETVLDAALAGHLLDPDDPRLRTTACIGAPGCARGTVAAPADAERLGRLLPDGAFLHVSGCAKGCAHPAAAVLTLVGRDGRYDLVENGRAGDPPQLRGLSLAELPSLISRSVSGAGRPQRVQGSALALPSRNTTQ